MAGARVFECGDGESADALAYSPARALAHPYGGFAQEVDAEASDPLTLALSLRERELRNCAECMADESLSRRERAG